MPKTLLLALIATAVSANNRSALAETTVKTPNNIRKLPLGGRRNDEENADQATRSDPAVAH